MPIVDLPIPKDRRIYLSAQVTQDSMLQLTKQILEINAEDKNLKKIYKAYKVEYKSQPIQIFIDSYGGNVYQCLGLLGVMKTSKTRIHTIVTGCAMSCGFLISINGHKRFAYEHSTLLYHQVASGVWGKLKDIQEDVEETKRVQKIIEEYTLKNTKIPKSRLEKSFKKKEDWYIPAKEALKLGCIDKILK